MTSSDANELEILVKTVMRGSVFARVCEAQANSPQKIFAEAHPTRYSTVSKIYARRAPNYRSLQMNIHEYQAKELLQRFNVATTRGKVASTLDEAEQIARELGDVEIVAKAQIHAGGRGKGTFKNGFKGGVHVRKSPKEVREVAE